MPEFLAYKCDACGATAAPIEERSARWHSKWCSVCLTRYYDVFVGGVERTPDGVPVVRDRSWLTDPHDNDYGPDAD
jgi:hypothetical protein